VPAGLSAFPQYTALRCAICVKSPQFKDVQVFANGRGWVYLQGRERGRRIALPLKGEHLPSGTVRMLLQPNGQVAVHCAVAEFAVCRGSGTVGVDKGCTAVCTDSNGERRGDLRASESDRGQGKGRTRGQLRDGRGRSAAKGRLRHSARHNLGCNQRNQRQCRHPKRTRNRLCHAAHAVVDKVAVIACEDLTAPRQSAPRMSGGACAAETGAPWRTPSFWCLDAEVLRWPWSIRPAHRKSTPARACLQGTRRGDRFCCRDGVVWDADTHAACNIPARLYDRKIALYTPHGDVKALLVERTRTAVGTARPGLGLRGLATQPSSTESEVPAPVPQCTGDCSRYAELRTRDGYKRHLGFPAASITPRPALRTAFHRARKPRGLSHMQTGPDLHGQSDALNLLTSSLQCLCSAAAPHADNDPHRNRPRANGAWPST